MSFHLEKWQGKKCQISKYIYKRRNRPNFNLKLIKRIGSKQGGNKSKKIERKRDNAKNKEPKQ